VLLRDQRPQLESEAERLLRAAPRLGRPAPPEPGLDSAPSPVA